MFIISHTQNFSELLNKQSWDFIMKLIISNKKNQFIL